MGLIGFTIGEAEWEVAPAVINIAIGWDDDIDVAALIGLRTAPPGLRDGMLTVKRIAFSAVALVGVAHMVMGGLGIIIVDRAVFVDVGIWIDIQEAIIAKGGETSIQTGMEAIE
jgi:hypothetical protein